MDPTEHPPGDETIAAIALVQRGDRWLVGRRPEGASLAGYAEFPGGKCLPGEEPEVCVCRECLEETGIAIRVEKLQHETRHHYTHGGVRLLFFRCVPVTMAEPLAPFRWVDQEELGRLSFPAANDAVIRQLLAGES